MTKPSTSVTRIRPDGLWLDIAGEEEVWLPFEHFPWFATAPVHHVFNVEGTAEHLRWPDFDVDLTLDIIRHPEWYPKVSRATEPSTLSGIPLDELRRCARQAGCDAAIADANSGSTVAYLGAEGQLKEYRPDQPPALTVGKPLPLLDVLDVVPLSDYTLIILFEDGAIKRYDVTPFLRDGTVFEALKRPAVFALAHVALGTVVWPGGVDIDPETLYAKGKLLDSVAVVSADSATGARLNAMLSKAHELKFRSGQSLATTLAQMPDVGDDEDFARQVDSDKAAE